MFDPKHESKLLKVHNSRDVIACSNSNLLIRYFHRYRHALLGLPRTGFGGLHHRKATVWMQAPWQRHCEELLRRSIPVFLRGPGLLRFARNDVESLFSRSVSGRSAPAGPGRCSA
jgi:hypothetical protein